MDSKSTATDTPASGPPKDTAQVLHGTVANRKNHEKTGFYQGRGEGLDRLVALANRS